jgi:hypothetical protein
MRVDGGAGAPSSEGGSPLLGSAQIGIGRRHDPAWITQYGALGDDEAMAVHASSSAVLLGGRTTSAWFGAFSDPCAEVGADAGRDCGDAFVFDVTSGAGVQFGQAQADEVRGVFATDAALYIAGKTREPKDRNFKNDGWVSELAPDLSSRRWDTRIENARHVDEVLALAVDGDLFISGGSSAPLGGQPTVGDEDAFLMRLAPGGTIGAVQRFGSTKFEEAMGVAVDASGVYTAGQTGGYLGSDPSGRNLGSTDVFLAVADRALTQVSCRADFGTAGKDVGQALAVFGDAIYVTGYTEGTMNDDLANGGGCNQALPSDTLLIDVFVSKYDKACRHQWTRQFGSRAGDTSDGIAADAEYVYVVGTTGGAADHTDTPDGTDAFLRVYSAADGDILGEIVFDSDEPGALHADLARAISLDDGFAYVVGRTAGDLGRPGSNLGGSDAFFAKIPLAETRGNVRYEGAGCDHR